MNKTELVNSVAEKTGLSKKDAALAVEATFGAIVDAMKAGDKVQLVGFGSFEVKTRAARTGRSPKEPTKVIKIPATKVPVFKAGKALKEEVR